MRALLTIAWLVLHAIAFIWSILPAHLFRQSGGMVRFCAQGPFNIPRDRGLHKMWNDPRGAELKLSSSLTRPHVNLGCSRLAGKTAQV